MWSNRSSHFAGGNAKWHGHFGRKFGDFYKLNIFLLYQSSNQVPWYLPKWIEKHIHTKSCIWMLTVALFIIDKSWKQLRSSLVSEWINKLWYIQRMEYCSSLKRNELSFHEKTWENLKHILLIERSQSERLQTIWFQLYVILIRQNYGDNKKISGYLGCGEDRDK